MYRVLLRLTTLTTLTHSQQLRKEMSSELVALNNALAWQIQLLQLRSIEQAAAAGGKSVVVPVQPAQAVQPGDTVYMYHDRLPPMQTLTLDGTDYNGHILNEDWIYTCVPQVNGGLIWQEGPAGLFTISSNRWITSVTLGTGHDTSYTWDLVVLTPDGSQYVVNMPPEKNQAATLFIEKGTRFYTRYNGNAQVDVYAGSEIVLTRLSTVSDYVRSPVVVP